MSLGIAKFLETEPARFFWGPMAYAMIGGIIVGTLLFLPALYVWWFRIKAPGHAADHNHESLIAPVLQTDPSADAGSHREMENAQALGIGVLCHSIPCSSPNAVNAIADRATARAHRHMRVKEGGLPEFGHSANEL